MIEPKKSDELPFVRLMNRYISVWLWSIVVGVTVSGIFSLPRTLDFGGYASASYILIAFVACAYGTYFLGLTYLGQYLRRFIIPYVLSSTEASIGDDAGRPLQFLARSFGLFSLGVMFHAMYVLGTGFLDYFGRASF